VSDAALRRMRARGWTGPVADGLVAGREAALTRIVGSLPDDTLRDGLVAAGRELASLGLTTVADATPRSRRALAPLRQVMDERRFLLRVHAMRPPGSRPWAPSSPQLVPGAVKILIEETPAGLRPTPPRLI